ncbi:MAG: AbiV family abortive infection protein [Bacteroidales bacterium]|nr:AbiV family abortive infection protein [Bacteroidales bacterium]
MLNKLIEAIYFTNENAISLYEDAELLENNAKFGRAYTLYHLCFEECGRFNILYNLFGEYLRGEIKLKEINYGKLKKLGFEKHDVKILESFKGIHKTVLVFLMIKRDQTEDVELKKECENEIEKLNEAINDIRINEPELNRLKNIGLYVSFNNNEFTLPDKTISVNQFYRIKDFARLGLKSLDSILEFAEAKGGFKEFKKLIKKGK